MTTKTGDVIVRSIGDHTGVYQAINLIGKSREASSEVKFVSRKRAVLASTTIRSSAPRELGSWGHIDARLASPCAWNAASDHAVALESWPSDLTGPPPFGLAWSDPEFVGEVVEVLAHDIERPSRFGLAGTRAAFARAPDMASAQSKFLS
jgi:hypothetical protein